MTVGLFVMLITPGCTSQDKGMGIFGHVNHHESGSAPKVLFTLGKKPFFPVIAYLPELSDAASLEQVTALQQQGFNVLMVAIDYPWLETRQSEIVQMLENCVAANMPVILELQEWDYWTNWLHLHADANMQMSTGERVVTFPDYANPETRTEHLRRYQALAEFARPYAGKPLAAVSIGAYDAYHIPDGETHALFKVPEHGDFPQTWLPYGPTVSPAYITFLQQNGLTPAELGFAAWEEVSPPSRPADTINALHWSTWNWFRKKAYVGTWLNDTANVVREASQLPVTISIDLRPDTWDAWATAPEQWVESLDFLLAFYYGTNQAIPIEERFGLLYATAVRRGVPLVSFMEFSSTLGTFTPADVYINSSAPYVSGFVFSFDPSATIHMQRLPDFLRLTAALRSSNGWRKGPSPAQAAIFLSTADPFTFASYESAARILTEANITYDVVYDPDSLQGYQLVYVPSRQNLLLRQHGVQAALDKLTSRHVNLIQGSTTDLREAIDTALSSP